MDVFIEKIVARQKTITDYLTILGAVFVGVIICFIFFITPALLYFSIFVLVGIVYGLYYFITSKNVEFEYIVTNDDMDIDKIISRRKRKRIFNASCKDFEVVAKISSPKFDEGVKKITKRIKAISSMASPDVYFAIVHYKSQKTVIFFEPNEKMLNVFKTQIPKKLFV